MKHESTLISYSDDESLTARRDIFNRLRSYPATDEETERSLGLFLRGSLLARILAIEEIYKKIIGIPGMIFDVGTWRGQTAVLCENFRAIHEPLHFNRRIACFDTFEGYVGFSEEDRATEIHKDGTYSTGGESAAEYLDSLLKLHEACNIGGKNSGKHSVIKGDCRYTIPEFFEKNPNEFVSLCFMDVNSVAPTRAAFDLIYERMAPGGIFAFWQLTRDVIPAEGIVYSESILGKRDHKLYRTASYPGLCYLEKA
jgi:hypothetical protein